MQNQPNNLPHFKEIQDSYINKSMKNSRNIKSAKSNNTRNSENYSTFEFAKFDHGLISSNKVTCVKDQIFSQINTKKVEEDVKNSAKQNDNASKSSSTTHSNINILYSNLLKHSIRNVKEVAKNNIIGDNFQKELEKIPTKNDINLIENSYSNFTKVTQVKVLGRSSTNRK